MVRVHCVLPCLLATVVAVNPIAPPAVVPPPMPARQAAPLPVASTVPGAATGIAGMPSAGASVAAQVTPRLRGQAAVTAARIAQKNAEVTLEEVLGASSPIAAAMYFEAEKHQLPTVASGQPSVAALLVAAFTGAMAAMFRRRRANVQKAMDAATKMTAASSVVWPEQPKFSVAACAGESSASTFAGSSMATAALPGPGPLESQPSQLNAAKVKKKGVRMVEGKEIPWNLFSPKAPYEGKCISCETITTETPLVNWETCHVIMSHDKKMPYVEGQSIGVVAPGPDKKGEKPAKIRLYSIASSAVGDDETSNTVSLVVKRVLEVEGKGWCEYSNVELPDPQFPDAKKVYRGVCSSHICDLKSNDQVLLTGPTGAEMLLPDDPEANIIMLATGTGIAPFRSFLRKLFHDKGTKGQFQGLAWLFLGVPYSNNLLYDDEWKAMQAEFPEQFRYDYAISDEMLNKEGKKMWVQHKVMEFDEAIWPMLKEEKTHVYMCGLKGMETGFLEAFGPAAEKEGVDLKEFVKGMKKGKRYHVEVY